jgi:hypothetical protein
MQLKKKTTKDLFSNKTLKMVSTFCLQTMAMGAMCGGVHRGGFGDDLLKKKCPHWAATAVFEKTPVFEVQGPNLGHLMALQRSLVAHR